MEDEIILTEAAAEKIKSLIENENAIALRVFVHGGGCSGFRYGFIFAEEINEDDFVVETNGSNIVIDPLSLQYIMGAKIDYTETLMGSQFSIDNPNTTNTCGCGSSFTV